MRAVQVKGPDAVAVEDVSPPVAADGEVIVDLVCAAICGTDRKLVSRGQPVGRTLGHEGAGRLSDGTPVGIHPDLGCGDCRECRAGQSNRCANRRSVGIDVDGCLAAQVRVPARHAVPTEDVPLSVVPLLEPLACCVHAAGVAGADRRQLGAVVGAGAMGILCLWTLQSLGLRVAVVQRSESRRRLAAELGADLTLSPDDNLESTAGGKPEVVLVTAPGADALTWALERVAIGGTVHAFAGTPGGAQVDVNTVHYRQLRLVGSSGSGLSDYHRALAWQRDGRLDLARLPTRTIELDAVPEALTGTERPDHLRTFVDLAPEGT